jgi:mRNA-degrading endonuclease toxin of MazEF toxin-antitoxin module
MKPWEIWSYQPPGWPEAHPAVIVSGTARVSHKPDVNILMCTSKQALREPLASETILDAADGLDWPTLCKCDALHFVAKASLGRKRGTVTPERRRQIIAAMLRSNEWL